MICIPNVVFKSKLLMLMTPNVITLKSPSDCIKLQDDICTLNSWSTQWKLYFNTSKCIVINVSRKQYLIMSTKSIGVHLTGKKL